MEDFIKDCGRECDRHEERCRADSGYCAAYVSSWSGINVPGIPESLDTHTLEGLLEKLEPLLHTDWALRTAAENLVRHIRTELRMRKDAESFRKAVASLPVRARA